MFYLLFVFFTLCLPVIGCIAVSSTVIIELNYCTKIQFLQQKTALLHYKDQIAI
jgi:hypothetical protein